MHSAVANGQLTGCHQNFMPVLIKSSNNLDTNFITILLMSCQREADSQVEHESDLWIHHNPFVDHHFWTFKNLHPWLLLNGLCCNKDIHCVYVLQDDLEYPQQPEPFAAAEEDAPVEATETSAEVKHSHSPANPRIIGWSGAFLAIYCSFLTFSVLSWFPFLFCIQVISDLFSAHHCAKIFPFSVLVTTMLLLTLIANRVLTLSLAKNRPWF